MVQRAAYKTCMKIFNAIGAKLPEIVGLGFSGFFAFAGYPLEIRACGDVTRFADTSLV